MSVDPSFCCRVCGLEYDERPWGIDNKHPSYDFCSCCGVQFGYQDTLLLAARKFREIWIKSGMKWDDPEQMPENWDPQEQLKNVPPDFK